MRRLKRVVCGVWSAVCGVLCVVCFVLCVDAGIATGASCSGFGSIAATWQQAGGGGHHVAASSRRPTLGVVCIHPHSDTFSHSLILEHPQSVSLTSRVCVFNIKLCVSVT